MNDSVDYPKENVEDTLQRTKIFEEVKTFAYNSYRDKPEDDAKHLLVFDMRDQFARSSFRLIYDYQPNEDLRKTLTEFPTVEQGIFQAVFVTDEVFSRIAIIPEPNFSFQRDKFGVLFFSCNGMKLSWLPIPFLNDGSTRRRI
jgi:hypothetical protein